MLSFGDRSSAIALCRTGSALHINFFRPLRYDIFGSKSSCALRQGQIQGRRCRRCRTRAFARAKVARPVNDKGYSGYALIFCIYLFLYASV